MKHYFISDLHLDSAHPEIAELFIAWLKSISTENAKLYILGDFFEVWIGDDDSTPFYQKIIEALKSAYEAGLDMYFMHGNRDFLIGKRFFKMTGLKCLKEETLIQIADIPILLMHGDTLCTEDKAYLAFRKKARCWFFQKLFLLKSLEKRRQIANKMREKSKTYTSLANSNILDVSEPEVKKQFIKHQVLHFIHGHTHRPAIHEYPMGSDTAKRFVLAAWHDEGHVLIWDDSGKIAIRQFHLAQGTIEYH